MHLTTLFSASTLLGSAISAPFALHSRDNSQMGSLTISNKCQANSYFWVVPGNGVQGPMQTLASGQSWSEQYQVLSNGAGISVKVGTTPQSVGEDNILQMEYTATPHPAPPADPSPSVWYDMSVINGNGGIGQDYNLTPSQSPGSGSSTCDVIQIINSYLYGEGDANHTTHTCSMSTNLVLNLCASS